MAIGHRLSFTIVALAATLLLPTLSRGELLLESGPVVGTGLGVTGGPGRGVSVQPFRLLQDATNVEIQGFLRGQFSDQNPVDALVYLTDRIGPGTANADVIASAVLPHVPIADPFVLGIWRTMLTVPSLAAGDYFVTLAPVSFAGTGSYAWQTTQTTLAVRGFFGDALSSNFFATDLAFPPASAFTTVFTPFMGRMNVSGDVGRQGVFGPTGGPTGIGGGATADFDAGEVLGDPGAQTTELGAAHRMDAQSFGGLPRDDKTNTINRSFFYEAAGTDPVNVFFFGILDGRLIADKLGDASVTANLRLFDEFGNFIAGDSHSRNVHSTSLRLVDFEDVKVFKVLGFTVPLTPGELYIVESTLTLSAFGGALGSGRAFFADTFEYLLSGVGVSPFVEIDIRPGIDPNPLHPASRGVLPVAILGGVHFDVADVDVTTLAFGPAAAAPVDNTPEDVNGDGLMDLVSNYRTAETGIDPEAAEACVTGETIEALPFEGCDAVRIACDVDGDQEVDIGDTDAIFAARGGEAVSPDDPMDADGDGVITVNDGRSCVFECTNPGCAVSIVEVASNPGAVNCGLLGIEPILLLGLPWWARRRRAARRESR